MTVHRGGTQSIKGNTHDRILLRLLQPLDLARLAQYPATGERVFRRDHLAADPGRRHLQYRQSERLQQSQCAGSGKAALWLQGPAGLGTLRGAEDQDATDSISRERGEIDARLHPAG